MEAAVGGTFTEEEFEECQPANHQKSELFLDCWILKLKWLNKT